ncbi:competence pheromone ComX [Kurthia sp. Dielmo]|uniref:competence pheromone ComX n=1 Tax=Kurthia sp. Dielmo TaxID=1033738 RepID=UPI00111F4010|nr:competence pheromone ComX [Kurthia sp. Dielmo]
MLEIIQYLNKNKSILSLLKEGKVSLVNISTVEEKLIIESFENKEKKTLKDLYSAYWRA